MSERRLDHIVQGLFPDLTRTKVQSLIERSKVKVNGLVVSKPGKKFDSNQINIENIEILDDQEIQYVSRGALKIKAILEKYQIPIKNKVCLDVGLSTGGFTDYLLQSGAAKVLGVDVGSDQVHENLRKNPRLIYQDKVNAREPLPQDLLTKFFSGADQKVDLVVIDVSFISLDKIIPSVTEYLKRGGHIAALIKPQFELQKSDLNKRGVVKDPNQIEQVVEKIGGVFAENQLQIIGTCPSPIEGENGNKEVLILARQP